MQQTATCCNRVVSQKQSKVMNFKTTVFPATKFKICLDGKYDSGFHPVSSCVPLGQDPTISLCVTPSSSSSSSSSSSVASSLS
jgi:hypothetical protein